MIICHTSSSPIGPFSLQESMHEAPFFLLYGRDARLLSILDMETLPHREAMDLNSYKEELVVGLSEAWVDRREGPESTKKGLR